MSFLSNYFIENDLKIIKMAPGILPNTFLCTVDSSNVKMQLNGQRWSLLHARLGSMLRFLQYFRHKN
jgi:hypothetical protein